MRKHLASTEALWLRQTLALPSPPPLHLWRVALESGSPLASSWPWHLSTAIPPLAASRTQLGMLELTCYPESDKTKAELFSV